MSAPTCAGMGGLGAQGISAVDEACMLADYEEHRRAA
eukprot:CAMPEP_0182890728 /NCGR_PEP_ID=MMETSP0034_2-20130328/22839_1 /TAXON_ID=156128 /ORGANISM="Nephroselmis pyriformis, Strain CCMP717" /LENGTH=36 /DNA_ID= /DNA_START= /DNA_END= /DNA_ORIENTATION=